ncbi:MAG: hypothetical protein ABFC96_07860 [Thermoguttaceae bacterium]
MRSLLGRLLAVLALLGGATSGWTADRPVPEFSVVRQTVLRHFQAQRDYRPGDLITREAAGPLLAKLKKLGLPLPDEKQLLADIPAENSFLATQLRTPDGRRFMRQIAEYPDAYDRLDRIARLPHGEQTVRDLIRGPDGYKMLQYMTTTPGGRTMGDMLSNAPGAGDFNAATGRVYTADDLLSRLEKSRDASVKAQRKPRRR